MIHQVSKSEPDWTILSAIVDFQLEVLSWAAKVDKIDKTDSRTKEGLIEYLARKGYEGASDAASWLFGCRLVEHLGLFARGEGAEKENLVCQMQEDVDLLFKPRPAKLQAAFRQSEPEWKRGAKGFCLCFYDIWDDRGLSKYLVRNKSLQDSIPEENYRRQDFIWGFLEANDGLFVCPICDSVGLYYTFYESRQASSDASRVLVAIDHFFPKSVYPHLALHPANLLPICGHCNTIKRDKDLMEFCGERGLEELLLPYQKNQPGLAQVAYIEVSPSDTSLARRHPLKIKIKPSVNARSAPLIEQFIRQLNDIYDLENRWNHSLDIIGEHVFRRMEQFFLPDVLMGNDLSDVWFVGERLEILMALTDAYNLGKDPFGMVTTWMLKYYADTIYTESALVYVNLKDWARKRRETWEMLQKHVQELYARVPAETA